MLSQEIRTAIGALTLIVEAQDFRRFQKPRQFMCLTGFVSSEFSSGQRVRRGSITKAGNAHIRRMLVEAAWSQRYRNVVSLVAGSQQLRDQVQAGLVSEHLDMLRRRKRHMVDRFDEDKDWKERDWSWVKRGMCVGWVELFPKSKAWAFEHEGFSIFVDDQYCVTASCACSEVLLSFFRIERRGPDESEGNWLGLCGRSGSISQWRLQPKESMQVGEFCTRRRGNGKENPRQHYVQWEMRIYP